MQNHQLNNEKQNSHYWNKWTEFMVLSFHIQYEQVSSAHLQAHNHLGPHQEDEE